MYGLILSGLVCFILIISYAFGGYKCCCFISLVISLVKVLIWRKSCSQRKRPGTVTHSRGYLSGKRYFQPKCLIKPTSYHSASSRQVVRRDIRSSNTYKFPNLEADSVDSGVFSSRSFETDMTSPSTTRWIGSPVRSARESLNSTVENDISPQQRTDMSVGEFPLISLVNSLHEAVSPKPHRLKPSPLAIRIQPPQTPEMCSEPVVDPVVSVLKQIASNKRVLAPTVDGEEQREKRNRGMPRHDLTHSLLESQLTTANRDVSSLKREREEGNSPVSSNGLSGANSAPKRLCARSLRSNEILSSLSSSISLVSPPPIKSYTGKRKNISFDKYKKLRRMEIRNNEVVSLVPSPVKVDKGVTTTEIVEKTSAAPLPVKPIKRDEISERVVSRAMVSALLKSTVTKLIMSGDPAVYPVPNGDQLRQPEVTPPKFGPPTVVTTSLPSPALAFTNKLPVAGTLFSLDGKTDSCATLAAEAVTTCVGSLSSTAVSTSSSLFPQVKPQASLLGAATPSFGLDTSGPATTSAPSVQFGIGPTSSAATASPGLGITSTSSQATSPVPTFGLPSSPAGGFKVPSTTSGVAPPNFSITSTGSSVSTTPSFGVPSTGSGVSTTPNFGIPSTASGVSTTPNFGIPSTASGVSTTPSFGISSTLGGAAPSSFSAVTTCTPSSVAQTQPSIFGSAQVLKTSGLNITPTTSAPSFNLTSTTTSSLTPTFSFVGSNEVKASTAPTFASVVAGTSAAPTFSLGSTTSSTNIFAASKTNAPVKFGESSSSSAPIFGGGTTTPVFGATPTTTIITPITSTVATTNAPVFGSTAVTSTPVFGSSGGGDVKTANQPGTTSSNIFGGSNSLFTSSTTPFGVGTTSSNIFGTTPAVTTSSLFSASTTPVFGGASTAPATSAPVFGASTTTSAPLFGNFTSTSTTSTAPIFGATTSTASNLFGGVSSSSTAPLFGTATTTAPVFGGSTTTPVFGQMTPVTTSTPMFGGTTTSSSTNLFGGGTSTTTQASLFGTGSASNTFASSGFGSSMSPAVKPAEGLFGMPSSASGFKTSSPFQVGGNNAEVSSTSGFGSGSGVQGKAFEFGGSKASSGGFTFKPGGSTAAPFTSPTPAAVGSTPSFTQPQSQPPFSFSGGVSGNSGGTSGSPFVFGTPQAQTPAPGTGVAIAPSAKPFQFNTTPVQQSATPTFGQTFTPTFPQSSPAPNLSFATASTPNAQTGFQFNAGGPTPQPTTPGNAGGLFSIGTGSSGTKARERRDRRRRV